MKPTPYHFLFLLCCLTSAYTLRAQDTSKIPSLKVWYEIPNVWNASYLEKFDTANGGNSALVLNRGWGEGQTIYMQGRGDTTNRFTWERWGGMGGGQYVETVDFNGDGVNDYLQGDGIIYRGKTKNAPPESIPVARYDITFYGIGRRCVADFNDDGKEDFLSGIVSGNTLGEAPGPFIGRIILGNSDLVKMKVLNMPQIEGTYPGAYSIQNIVSAWRENGKNYMVVYNYTPDGYKPRSDAFELCEFVILSDTAIIYTTLDHVPYKAWPNPNTPYYGYSSSFVWHSRDGHDHTFVATWGPNVRKSEIYSIVNGQFIHAYHKETPEYDMWPLAYSVKSMDNNGYARCYSKNCFLYHGNPADDSLRIARLPTSIGDDEYVLEQVTSVGDINNDAKGDIGAVYVGNNTGILRIYLGADSISHVESREVDSPVLTINDPQVGSDGTLAIQMHIAKPGRYSLILFDILGKHVQSLMDEQYQIGDYTRQIQISKGKLPFGLYNLRLSDGTRAVDKGIMITP